MLLDKYSIADLKKIIINTEDYHPFPDAGEREEWNAVAVPEREKFIAIGEGYLNYEWPSITATRYMDFYRTGNRTRFPKLYFERRYALASMVIAECLEGKGRFLDQIINGIWLILEETSWVVPAINNKVADNNYQDILPAFKNDQGIGLFSAETGALLSWTYYLLKELLDEISPRICQGIEQEVSDRIIDQYLRRDDLKWMGFKNPRVNNWNPWCNSNCLSAFLLIEKNRERRLKGIKKILSSLDIFLDTYPEDGGCDEGPQYWNKNGGSLFDCLELLYSVSAEKINHYDNELIKNIAQYIYRVHIDSEYFLNFADGHGRLFQQPDLIYRFGKRIDNQKLMNFGAEFYHLTGEIIKKDNKYFPLFRILPAVFNGEELRKASHKFPYQRDVWLPEIEVMAARKQEGSKDGLYLGAKASHNRESHNHNDVGHFMLYVDGQPCLIDAGVGTYTAKTFSDKRYEIWTMCSNYHNLPTINGVEQAHGREFKAKDVEYDATENEVVFSMDIANAYPVEAGIEYWQRSFIYKRSDQHFIELNEDFSLQKKENHIRWNFLTVCPPEQLTNNRLKLTTNAGSLIICYNENDIEYSLEEIEVTDNWLIKSWGDMLYRIKLDLDLTVDSKVVKFVFRKG